MQGIKLSFLCSILLVGQLICICGLFWTLMKKDKKEMILQQQNQYYTAQLEVMKKSMKVTRAFRHDWINHLYTLRSCILRGDYQEALSYMERMREGVIYEKEYSASGNIVVDSVLNVKIKEAEEKGILVTLNIKIPREIPVESYDMTVILGNILDNAITAAGKIKNRNDRMLYLDIVYDRNCLTILCENSVEERIVQHNEKNSFPKKNEEHGIGLQNISKAVKRYNGMFRIEMKEVDKKFLAYIMMYV